MEKTWSPAVLRDLKQWVWAEEYQQMKQHREKELSLLKDQIDILKNNRANQLAQTIAWIIALACWAATVIGFLSKLSSH